jgi:hypothetical protein
VVHNSAVDHRRLTVHYRNNFSVDRHPTMLLLIRLAFEHELVKVIQNLIVADCVQTSHHYCRCNELSMLKSSVVVVVQVIVVSSTTMMLMMMMMSTMMMMVGNDD